MTDVTQQVPVAEVLDGENVHLSAEEVLDLAQTRLPEMGRATVYKALAEFVNAGAVREVRSTDGAMRFDPNAHITWTPKLASMFFIQAM